MQSILKRFTAFLLVAAIGLQGQALAAMSLERCAGPTDGMQASAGDEGSLQATVHDADLSECKCTSCVVCHSPALTTAPVLADAAAAVSPVTGPSEALPIFTTHPPQRPPRR